MTVAIWVGHLPFLSFTNNSVAWAEEPVQLVQIGVASYAEGDYLASIEHWQAALDTYPEDSIQVEHAIIHTNLAKAYRQVGQTENALTELSEAAKIYEDFGMQPKLGRIQTEQAQIYASLGQYRRAITLICLPSESSTEVEAISRESRPESVIQHCASGAYPIALNAKDLDGQVASLGSLGEVYSLKGEYESAISILETSLSLAESIPTGEDIVPKLSAYKISIFNSLGNAYRRGAEINYQRAEASAGLTFEETAENFREDSLQQAKTAADYFNRALNLPQIQADPIAEARTRLNLLKLYRRDFYSDFSPVELASIQQLELASVQQRLEVLIPQLPDSREVVYAAISLAKSYRGKPSALSCYPRNYEQSAIDWLTTAQEMAERIGDFRAQSFATGQLGHLYECRGESAFTQAFDLTFQAEWQANEALASADSEYLWQWQAGRLYEKQGDRTTALDTYNQAIQTLETIREDILTANQDFQFDFRDAVAPLYRGMIELQLQLATPDLTNKQNTESENDTAPLDSLASALVTADSLKLAELQNYFGDDCLLSSIKPKDIISLTNEGNKAAVISSITFLDKTALILSLPETSPRLEWINEDSLTLRSTADEYLELLKKIDFTYSNPAAEQLYDWIIRPFETDLRDADVDTIVFIQDGILRSIPMAALWDGNHYLIEKFATAITPSLTLTDPKPLRSRNLQALAVGLSESICIEGDNRTCYGRLRKVPNELELVTGAFPGSPQPLLNDTFTRENLAEALKNNIYPILHIATHGQFSTDPDDTFIVTGAGERLTFGALEKLIRENSSNTEPIELISLTACQTGVGDDRAALGLAGVAIRSGARSAIASLWLIDDSATADIMGGFYEYLNDQELNLNKAQALRQAQIDAIEPGVNPGNWAALILIGNWL